MRLDQHERGHALTSGEREACSSRQVPAVSVVQMREVDRLMVVEVGVTLLQMMENAGRALATHVRLRLAGDLGGRRVVVLAGAGGNGGGGLAAARRLVTWGAGVDVVLAQPADLMGPAAGQQLRALRWMGVGIHPPEVADRLLAGADAVADALIGYGLAGAPRPPIAGLIQATNACDTCVIALDLPSGLAADSGEPAAPTIRATTTLTLALPKTGLLAPPAREWVGELYLADISVPAEVYRRVGVVAADALFARDDIVRLTNDGSVERGCE